MLRRKVDDYLIQWKNNPDRLPLVIKYNKPKIWTKNSKNSEFAVL